MKYLKLILMTLMAMTWSGVALSATPYLKPNNSWIVIDGKVKSVKADAFELDYGNGLITVEMDDGDRDADGYKLIAGDKVSVSGMVDDDLFEERTIEAARVYVENIGTTFYASSIDDEDLGGPYYYYHAGPVVPARTVVSGTVTSIDGRQLEINTGNRKVTIDTNSMPYNPLDSTGYLKVEKGDSISVAGIMTNDFFDGKELEASSLVKIYDSEKIKKKNKAKSGKS